MLPLIFEKRSGIDGEYTPASIFCKYYFISNNPIQMFKTKDMLNQKKNADAEICKFYFFEKLLECM